MSNDTRTRMVETTAQLLQQRGYHGTALSGILNGSRAPRGSLYFHFPGGKDQLVIEATRLTVAAITRGLEETLQSADKPSLAVRAFIVATAEAFERTDFRFGCPVAPVILDGANDVEELTTICRETFETWIGQLEMRFVQSGIAAARAKSLAALVHASVEGMLLIARAYRSRAPMMKIADELEAVVEAAWHESKRRPAQRAIRRAKAPARKPK